MNSPDYPPEDFWPQVLAHDQRLHKIARVHGGWPPFRRKSQEAWGYMAPLDESRDSRAFIDEDPRRRVLWEGIRTLGAWSINGGLTIGQAAGSNARRSEVKSLLKTVYSYGIRRGNPDTGILLVTHTANDPQKPGQPTAEVGGTQPHMSPEELVDLGLLDPDYDQYMAFLAELERGASGGHQTKIPPPPF